MQNNKDNKALKIGYSTGSHAASALKAAVLSLFGDNSELRNVQITLPEAHQVRLDVSQIEKTDNYVRVEVIKTDNDDVDATKGCKIICWAGYDLEKVPYSKHEITHNPYQIDINGMNLSVWAGKGLGIVTKEGLNPPVGFPAINSVPLDMMKRSVIEAFDELRTVLNKNINVIFEVENGDQIAKDTANSKAGVIGGISFLGKKGIVKPISVDAYLDSIKEEISVADKNSSVVVLTMGNSSCKFAQEYYNLDKECFIEIGNFVFETLKQISDFNFTKVSIVSNIGKLTKIAQGKKNTNNRFGDIDFVLLQNWMKKEDFAGGIINKASSVTTVGALEEYIMSEFPDCIQKFYQLILIKALDVLKGWVHELNIMNMSLEIAISNGDELKALICDK